MKKLFAILVILGLIFAGCTFDGEVSVVYHGNGETSGFPPTDDNKYKVSEEAEVLGQGILLKEGYTFKNWNTKKDGSGTSYEVGQKITIKGQVTLYAQWEQE
jgi:uncharacterized repeat protein (TIGR02543 family)